MEVNVLVTFFFTTTLDVTSIVISKGFLGINLFANMFNHSCVKLIYHKLVIYLLIASEGVRLKPLDNRVHTAST